MTRTKQQLARAPKAAAGPNCGSCGLSRVPVGDAEHCECGFVRCRQVPTGKRGLAKNAQQVKQPTKPAAQNPFGWSVVPRSGKAIVPSIDTRPLTDFSPNLKSSLSKLSVRLRHCHVLSFVAVTSRRRRGKGVKEGVYDNRFLPRGGVHALRFRILGGCTLKKIAAGPSGPRPSPTTRREVKVTLPRIPGAPPIRALGPLRP